MNNRDGERYNTFITANQFGKENAADFPAGTVGGNLFAEIAECITLLNQHGANQSSAMSSSKQNFGNKDTARENVREELTDMARMARSMAYEIEGLDDKFRVPINRNDRQLLTVARAFLTDAEPYKAKFIEYGLPSDCSKICKAVSKNSSRHYPQPANHAESRWVQRRKSAQSSGAG